MTVIVVHKGVIASDSLLSDAGQRFELEPTQKFGRLANGTVYAGAGDMYWLHATLAHIEGKRTERPATATFTSLLGTLTDGGWSITGSENDHARRAGPTWAMGSGDEYANAALILGHDAISAVWCAMQLSQTCGGVIFHASIDELVRVGNGAIKQTDPYEYGKRFPAIAEARATEAQRCVQPVVGARRPRATPRRRKR